MMSSNLKKITSTGIISLFILSIFASVPSALAQAPYITVHPSSVRPGQMVLVRGYNFPALETVDIYIDEVNDYHKLGSVVTNYYGRFTFSFVMQPSYPGTHTIIAVHNTYEYYADFTLRYTNPLDQRLIDLINELNIEVEDIEAKLDERGSFWTFVNDWFLNIEGKLDDIEGKLWSNVDSVKSEIDAINAKLDGTISSYVSNIWKLTGNVHGWGNLAEALDDIKDEIVTIDSKLDDIIAKPDFTGTFTGNYSNDPAFNPLQPVFDKDFIAVNPVIGTGTGTIGNTPVSFTFEGYLESDWGHYSALGKGALVTGRFNITTSAGDQIHIEINGIQREVWDTGYTNINHLTGTYTIITGTGAYRGATGSGTIIADINTNTNTFSGSFDGIIKY